MSAQTLTVTAAREFILQHCPVKSTTEVLPLSAALNRVLAVDVESNIQLPSCNNSAMDGYAFRFADVAGQTSATLPIVGESLAGHPFEGEIPAGAALRITTGACVPERLDTVIPFEKTQFTDTTVAFDIAAVQAGANVRLAGEEIERADTVLTAGTRLTAAHIALLASIGLERVVVYEAPRVAVLVTGDELSEPGELLPPGGVYNSNGPALAAMLVNLGCSLEGPVRLPDDPQMIATALGDAARRCDMVLMTGGAADSKADHSQQLLCKLGELFNWTVNMRPGRPMRFGRIGPTPVFVLPGNPVASIITFIEFVRGAILKTAGVLGNVWPREYRATAGEDIRIKPGRAEFIRARFTGFVQGSSVATPLANQSSASLLSMSRAQVLIAVEHTAEAVKKGDRVVVHLLSELL